ncbi:hypothetical protein MKY95_10180 [Paenibacillus sp. FSL P4-0176]
MVQVKPIPKTNLGLNSKQKEILKSCIGAMPNGVNLNRVREWMKYEK